MRRNDIADTSLISFSLVLSDNDFNFLTLMPVIEDVGVAASTESPRANESLTSASTCSSESAENFVEVVGSVPQSTTACSKDSPPSRCFKAGDSSAASDSEASRSFDRPPLLLPPVSSRKDCEMNNWKKKNEKNERQFGSFHPSDSREWKRILHAQSTI